MWNVAPGATFHMTKRSGGGRSRSQTHAALDPGPGADGGRDRERAAQRLDAIAHVGESLAGAGTHRVEAGPVVLDDEAERLADGAAAAGAARAAGTVDGDADAHRRRAGVLGDVLQRLEAAEVD